MGIDASIPLQVQNNAPSVQQMYSLANMAQQFQDAQNQRAAQNKLKELYQDPENKDEQGNLKQNALTQIMQIDPRAGMQIQQNMLVNNERQMHVDMLKSDAFQKKFDVLHEANTSARASYEDALKSGMPQDRAIEVGQKALSERLDELKSSGMYSDAEQQKIPTKFDPQSFDRLDKTYLQYKTFLANQDANKLKQQLAVHKEERETKHGDEEIAVQQQNAITHGKQEQLAERKADAENPSGEGSVKPSDTHGDDYLKSLPSSDATIVKALAEGRKSFPTSFALKTPYWRNMLQQVANYDPSFDEVNYQARAKTRSDFSSGTSAKNITSFNTAIGHMGTLYDAADKLDNSTFRTYNTVKNWVKSETGAPEVNNFKIAAQAVSDELERAFRGTGGNLHEIQQWQERLSSSNSPAQLKDAVKTGVELLRSRIDAVNEQYKRGMGTTADVTSLLNPKALETLKKLPGGGDIAGKSDKKEPEAKGEEKKSASGKSPYPDHPDAKQADDGKWYVQKEGKWFRIEP